MATGIDVVCLVKLIYRIRNRFLIIYHIKLYTNKINIYIKLGDKNVR